MNFFLNFPQTLLSMQEELGRTDTFLFFHGHICKKEHNFLINTRRLHAYTVKPPYNAPHHAGMPLGGKICKRHQKSGLKDF